MISLQSTVKRIQKARTALLLDHPLFGTLLFRLKGCEQRGIKTMATDGVSLFYNPTFVDSLNSATLAGVLAHEVMHPAIHHHLRRGNRNPTAGSGVSDRSVWIVSGNRAILPSHVGLDRGTRGPVWAGHSDAMRLVAIPTISQLRLHFELSKAAGDTCFLKCIKC